MLPMPSIFHVPSLIFAALAILGLMEAGNAHADFSDSYFISSGVSYQNPPEGKYGTWSFSAAGNRGVYAASSLDTTAAPASVQFDPGPPAPNSYPGTLTLTLQNTAAADGFLSFDYHFLTGYRSEISTAHDETYGQTSNIEPNYSDQAGYFVNSTFVYFTPGSTSAADGSVANIVLQRGDSFGFFATSGPKSVGSMITSQSQLTISNFSAPEIAVGVNSSVPEPTSICLLALSGSVLLFRSWKNGNASLRASV